MLSFTDPVSVYVLFVVILSCSSENLLWNRSVFDLVLNFFNGDVVGFVSAPTLASFRGKSQNSIFLGQTG